MHLLQQWILTKHFIKKILNGDWINVWKAVKWLNGNGDVAKSMHGGMLRERYAYRN